MGPSQESSGVGTSRGMSAAGLAASLAGIGLLAAVVVGTGPRGRYPAPPKPADPDAPAPVNLAAADPAKGRALFANPKGLNCIGCHRINGEGGEVGPDLSAIGAKYDKAKLMEAIVNPSKDIAPEYKQVQILTGDGVVLAGVVRSENDDQVVLVDANGKKTELPKDEIEARKESKLSLMPEGFAARMSPQEMEDLLAYLGGLKGPAAK